MEVSGTGKSPNTTLSFRYNANNEELEELYHMCDDDPPTPQCEPLAAVLAENASPKKADKGSSILDKYFKSMRTEKPEKVEDKDMPKSEPKPVEEVKPANPPKEATASPMKEYLNRLGKRNYTSEGSVEQREGSNETWKIFHDFKFKIAQAVEDIKTRSVDETKEKSVPRDNSMSDSEENSAIKDDQQSVGDTDNQVSSLDSSIQNLSEMTQPVTAKPTDAESSLPLEKNNSESSDDTHKNLANSESAEGTGDLLEDSCMMEVESGVEALEDTNIDGFGDINALPKDSPSNNAKLTTLPSLPVQRPSTPANFGSPPSKTNIQHLAAMKVPKNYFLNLTMYILTFIVVVNYFLFPKSNVWNGFFMGIWFFYFVSSLKEWLIDNYLSDSDTGRGLFQLKRSSAMPPTYTIPVVKEHRHLKKFEDWVNHYRFQNYDPVTYHINKTTTAFMKLEGCNLRLSYTRTKIAKRAIWDEKIDKVSFYQHRLYNLSGARIVLLPNGLTSKRQWSKKYPICIILNEKEKIQVLEKETPASLDKKMDEYVIGAKKKDSMQESEATETSPEKKRKFVWRRREKSLSHSEGEPGKEGLRQRFVRKMHRDKKTDSVSTATEPDHEPKEQPDAEHVNGTSTTPSRDDAFEEIDDADIAKLKDLLEETERESISECNWEGEWSVHVKPSRDKHAHLYLFGRTGRNKHELFRRLNSAIYEANHSAETSAADDRTASDPPSENKDGAEMATYNVIEEKTVTFARGSKQPSLCTEASSPFIAHTTVLPDLETYEKTFWPFLIKIMQTHEMNIKLSADAGVMCQIEPTPHERSKTKKKRKIDAKSSSPTCHCRMLPAEVSWVNTVLARVFYDVMRDPAIILRVQNKIQRKLNTLKLPSFMSPLIITELSLAGACPLVERVAPPAWDERGVWLDADLRYDGGACITILTQINLMKLKEKNLSFDEHILTQQDNVVERDSCVSNSGELSSEQLLRKRKPAIFDSDVEDSAESSSDDEAQAQAQAVDSFDLLPAFDSSTSKLNVTATPENPGSSKKKFLRMVDKISTNKYFQQVTDFKYIKRAMEGLSNTDIKLQLEVEGLEGRLAFNLPPPPHDRLWLGFRTNPQLVLKARPAVGARTLRFAHITNWIEHKLNKEFEKFLVLPNMEDISVDVMTPTPVHFE